MIRILGSAFSIGLGVAAVPLILTHLSRASVYSTYAPESFPNFVAWAIMLFVAAAFLAMIRPSAALATAAVLELGFVVAFGLDVAHTIVVGVLRSNIWPIAIGLVLSLLVPVVGLGSLVGAGIGTWRDRMTRSSASR